MKNPPSTSKPNAGIPSNTDVAYRNRATLEKAAGRRQAALGFLQQALTINAFNADTHLQLGIIHFELKQYDQAIGSLTRAMELKPSLAEAHYYLGASLRGLGRYAEAIGPIQKASTLKPDWADAHYKLGLTYHQLGRFHEAIPAYRAAIELKPEMAEAHNDLGVALQAQGQYEEALACIDKAIELSPRYVNAYLNRGVVLSHLGEADASTASYRKAIDLDPNYALAHHNLGNNLSAQGKFDAAIECFHKALAIDPRFAKACFNLAVAHSRKGDFGQAISAYEKAIELRPGYVEAVLNLGSVFHHVGRLEESVACNLKVIELRPDYWQAYNNLGYAYLETGKSAKAVEALRQAIRLNPDAGEAYLNLSSALCQEYQFDEALIHIKRAIELRPGSATAYGRLAFIYREIGELADSIDGYKKAVAAKCAAAGASPLVNELCDHLTELKGLPILYENESEIDDYRQAYWSSLQKASSLVKDGIKHATREEVAIIRGVLFEINNFYLAYQQRDDRELQEAYSDLVTRILADEFRPFLAPLEARKPGQKIRLGIVSRNLGHHNGSFWAYNWLANLSKEDYEFFLYSLNGGADDFTRKFAELGTYRWLPFIDENYRNALEIIKGDDLDVLLIPDVGMSPASKILSLLRLARVQCVGWGHPVTTGSANIDFYLSSDFMESEEADSHYSEKLVRLPNIGLNFSYPDIPDESLSPADFGIPEGRTIYGAVQSLFKYLPQFDYIYPAIAKRIEDALFVFCGNQCSKIDRAFERRLRKSFAEQGLDYDRYVKMLPRMPQRRFIQLLGAMDVYLDSIGWNGGITTMRALAMNCPVVTVPGEFMRGRHSCAMLRMIGVEELIADSLDGYIDLAVKLGRDRDYLGTVKRRISDRKHKLFNDMECVRYLDRFIKSAVGV